MNLRTIRIAALLILAATFSAAHAQQNLIWDTNGASGGFFTAGSYADGTWNNANTLWTTDPTGVAGHVAWNDAAALPDNAIFMVAGASPDPGHPDPLTAKDAVVTLLGGSRPASNLTVENGWVQLNTAVSGTNVNVTTGTVTVKTGAKLEVDNATGFFEIAHTAGASSGGLVLDGGTIINSNPGAGTTFYSTAANIRMTSNGGFINVINKTNTGSVFGTGTANAGAFLVDGGTTSNGGAGVMRKIGPGELRAQNASMANNTFAQLHVNGTGMLTSGLDAFGMWRMGNVVGANFETAFGAVPLTVDSDAILLENGGMIGAGANLGLHPNRGVTIGTGGGGSWGSGGSNVIINGPLSGSGTLISTGTASGGIVLQNPSNTFSGNVILRSGFLTLNHSLSTPNLSGDGFLTATPTQLFGTANIAPGKVFTVGSDGASTSFDGRLTGAAGTFRKVGAGTLTLDTILAGAESTNLGTADIQAGSIQFGTASSGFGDATTVNIASGATLDMNSIGDGFGGFTGAGNVINHNATTGTQLTLRGAGTYSHSGTISGSGVVNVSGAPVHAFKGSQTFAGANTYSGGTNVQGGQLLVNNTSGSGTGTGAVSVTGGTLGGSGSIDGAITVGTGTFTYGAAPNAKTLNTAGHVGGGSGAGTGTVLTATSTVAINSGGSLDATLGTAGNSDRLKVNSLNGLSLSTGGLLTLDGNSSAITGTYTVLEHNGLGSGTATDLNINNATGFEITGGITNTGTAFTVTMTNTAQTRSWATDGSEDWSSAAADAGNWSGGSGGQPNGPGATVTMGNTGSAATHTVTITDSDKIVGTLNLDSNDYTIASTAASTHRLVTQKYSGSAAINVAAGTHTISAPLTAKSNTNVSVPSGLTLNVTGGIVNDGGLHHTGAGTLAITSADYEKIVSNNSIIENSGAGNMTISISGSGVAGSPGAVGPIGIVSNNSGGSIVNSGSGSLTIANSGTGIFVNQGTVSNTAGGTLTVNGTTTTSATAYSNTTLSTTTPGVVGVFSNTGSGTLDINDNIVDGAGVRFSNSTTGTMTVDGVISGGLGLADAGNVYIDGPGTVVVTGVNTNSGRKILKAGKMEITQERALGAIPLAQGGYYDDITFDGGTLRTTATVNLVIDAGRGMFVKAGGGTIETANASGIRTEFSGTIFGTGTLNKTGNRQLRLGGNSFLYTGNVNINQGTLAVVNTTGTATGTGPVAVNSTGTLSGTGRVGGLLTVNSGGEISPALGTGAGGIGSINLAGGLTLNSGSLLDIQLGAPSSADLINVTGGTTTINSGILNLTDTGGLAIGTYPIIDYVGALAGSASNLTFGTTPAGFNYSIQDTGSLINLLVSAGGLVGDFNEDDKVDAADYVIWRKNETANNPLPNDSGLGNQAARFDLWKANFGNMTMPGGGGGAVPESGTLALLLLGALLTGIRRRV